jgi:hypothetical protein
MTVNEALDQLRNMRIRSVRGAPYFTPDELEQFSSLLEDLWYEAYWAGENAGAIMRKTKAT